jgi:UDP-N-acetylmuramyl pentapeptide phosphotransferase/UDP-N-acetylglucosamine-1-phosphate transferase
MPDSPGAWSIIGILSPAIWLGALIVSALLILAFFPLFRNFALAEPNHRSSHTVPTPQWGGLAIVLATLGAIAVAAWASPVFGATQHATLLLLVLATLLLMLLGAADDLNNLGHWVKLGVQGAAVALMLIAVPDDLRALPMLPFWLERGLLFIAAVAFVNLVNFMDGIDWMMVAEVLPISVGVALIGALGALPPEALIVALALNGAMLGFAPFNRPVARLFMGDMGSLPIGLLLAWLLITVAASGYLAAALLLPLYFLADTGLTLLRRLRSGERLSQAHRTHFYQRARDNGLSTLQIVGRVFAINAALVALAALSVVAEAPVSGALALLAGACLVGWLLIDLARRR